MKVIFTDVPIDDFILATRAVRYLRQRTQKDAIVSYGEGPTVKHFYVRRNKASISVRPCEWTAGDRNA